MSVAPKPKLSAAEYLARERLAERKSEFLDGEMFAMAGASREHNTIKENLSIAIGSLLKNGPCRTYSSDQRVLVERTGLYTYPDLLILCGPGEFDPLDRDTLLNPTAIIEILSPSTEKYDRGAKFRHYQQIPSLKEYLLVAQDEPVCERFVRQEDGSWALIAFVGLNDLLKFHSVTVQIPLAEVYADVAFSSTDRAI